MFERVILFRVVLLIFFLTLVILLLLVPPPNISQLALSTSTRDEAVLTVAFLDVGQGDAIYIETPDGVQLLIDGGPDSAVLRELPTVMPVLDRNLDVVLATHSDKDHIGGLVDVFKRYEVERVVLTENSNTTSVADAFSAAVLEEGVVTHLARAGQQYALGASTTLLILSPATNPQAWESNAASIVALLEYGDTSFLLTGDAGVNTEEYLVSQYGSLLASDVLKLGHHGSDTSTSELFLETVEPRIAIVSAGRNNSYGHPHSAVVAAVEERGIILQNTATEGTLIYKSDGVRLWRE